MTYADKLEAEAKRLRAESDKWAHLPEAYPHASAQLIAERDEALAGIIGLTHQAGKGQHETRCQRS